ncbi:unnamed protein product [Eruca vesicaria subsp. sativa]|uniref:Cyclopropane-fatty-acyl-phospholipid synthase n=1 Tax=Eruca vesicaria subsp. sativa TaxID=29727 RepID=A0ABC8JCJ6_ERUVS|nr:unnamed protein product [Eruca vesicaria subsp. sativa]
MAAARGLLGKGTTLLTKLQHMALSLTQSGARLFVTRFLRQFISIGCVTILEDGGTMITFGGNDSNCLLKSILKIHSPQFYWKVHIHIFRTMRKYNSHSIAKEPASQVMTEADLGLADAYISGDFSFVDKDLGMLNLIMVNNMLTFSSFLMGWWTPMFLTASLASVKHFLKHVSRQNTLTQARRNISRHYDLSNELFSLFMDDTMSYSSAVFKAEYEDLKTAQMRKITLLIEKARIEKNHEVLEIGCGWGALAIEVVKRTGCKYTGITLSIQQLKYAEAKVKEAELEDRITFKFCDYRQLSDAHKYDRIIACEMIEAVGHEFYETFFTCCEAVLAKDGIFVMQFTAVPEELYDETRLTSGFITEYIFPGGCLPSLARVTSAMSSSSGLCIENIGIHYYHTLRRWRKRILENQKQIMDLGFDDKFIRTWEYYFDYVAAGFKTLTLRNYQKKTIACENSRLHGSGASLDNKKAALRLSFDELETEEDAVPKFRWFLSLANIS